MDTIEVYKKYKGRQQRATHMEWDKWLSQVGVDTSGLEVVGSGSTHLISIDGKIVGGYTYATGVITTTRENGERWWYSQVRGELTVTNSHSVVIRREQIEFPDFLERLAEPWKPNENP